MPDLDRSGWVPQARLPGGREGDAALFERLHEAMAASVTPLFQSRFRAFSARELARSFASQAEALRRFLLDKVESEDHDPGPDLRSLQADLERSLQVSLPADEAKASDDALASEMAREFARAAWATMVSELHRRRRPDARVAPAELLPGDLLFGQTPLVEEVLSDARHFELRAEELNVAMFKTLNAMLEAETDRECLRLPLGLKVDRPALEVHLRDAVASYRRARDAIQARAAKLDREHPSKERRRENAPA
ncbi:hypothetical protein QTH97_26330 [Variovorax sp. J22R24]|uniref:hypothetical protein n=1 Tax=Variovorax gracilis TaxID=3053502 RepID=UPI0025778EE8|nr:hypothetical protein [Variovorax sp. J22R24]MDM0108493.1 hypothetical protein [Variovorax sp. J22R24]